MTSTTATHTVTAEPAIPENSAIQKCVTSPEAPRR